MIARSENGPASRPFVIVSGLPASGKTTLARRLAPDLELPVIDKDDILESLFDSRGVGDADWRRALSRESDEILRRQATSSRGAILVSFWRIPGMSEDSGTPSSWLQALSDQLVNVHCRCDPAVAARRFVQRDRHPGHLDPGGSYDEILASFSKLSCLASIEIGNDVFVDTTCEPDLLAVVLEIRSAFERCSARR